MRMTLLILFIAQVLLLGMMPFYAPWKQVDKETGRGQTLTMMLIQTRAIVKTDRQEREAHVPV